MITLKSHPCAPCKQPMQFFVINRISVIAGFLRLFSFFFLFCALSANALDVYIAAQALGTGDGSSSNNAAAWSKFEGNSGGYIPSFPAGGTIHLVGVITNCDPTYHIQIGMFCSGTPGNPITIKFEPGAVLSGLNNNAISMQSQSNIVVDGGVNGVIEHTGCFSGSGANPQIMVMMSNARDITIKNLNLLNSYIRTSSTDETPSGGNGVIYANQLFGTNVFINDIISNQCWSITMLGSDTGSLEVSNCSFYNYDHGVVPNSISYIDIENCHFGASANWDDTAGGNDYHHDCIHYFGDINAPQKFVIAGNLFTGDRGATANTIIFLEANPINVLMYNNVFQQQGGHIISDGLVYAPGRNNQIYNNTFIGEGIASQGGLVTGGTNLVVVNNIFQNLDSYVWIKDGADPLTVMSNNVYAVQNTDGNAFWQYGEPSVIESFSSLSAWQAKIGDANSTLTNNAVVDAGGNPIAGGLAIGAGANLISLGITTDFGGNARPSFGAWRVGAFQSSTGVTAPAVTAPKGLKAIGPSN